MRTCLFTLLAGIILAATASETQAQFVYRGTYVAPTPYPGNYGYSSYYASPYGYQSSASTGVYPTPYGYNSYYSYNTTIRPLYTGPVHSVTWDPFNLTYRYGTGYANTPNYSFQYYNNPYPYPTYP